MKPSLARSWSCWTTWTSSSAAGCRTRSTTPPYCGCAAPARRSCCPPWSRRMRWALKKAPAWRCGLCRVRAAVAACMCARQAVNPSMVGTMVRTAPTQSLGAMLTITHVHIPTSNLESNRAMTVLAVRYHTAKAVLIHRSCCRGQAAGGGTVQEEAAQAVPHRALGPGAPRNRVRQVDDRQGLLRHRIRAREHHIHTCCIGVLLWHCWCLHHIVATVAPGGNLRAPTFHHAVLLYSIPAHAVMRGTAAACRQPDLICPTGLRAVHCGTAEEAAGVR